MDQTDKTACITVILVMLPLSVSSCCRAMTHRCGVHVDELHLVEGHEAGQVLVHAVVATPGARVVEEAWEERERWHP